MTYKPLPVFGLDGRSADDVRAAVGFGYRRFDAAQAYGDTTDALARAIESSPASRNEFQVLYKFDVDAGESPDQLKARLRGVADKFDGTLQAGVIHNLGEQSEEAVLQAWGALHDLKREGTLVKVGVGNVSAEHAGLLKRLQESSSGPKPIDLVDVTPRNSPKGSQQGSQHPSREHSPGAEPRGVGATKSSGTSSPLLGVVENSAQSILGEAGVRDALAGLTDKTDLYYYNVVSTLKRIQRYHDPEGRTGSPDMTSKEGVIALGQQVGSRTYATSHMVLSSGDRDRMKDNLADFDIDFAEQDWPSAQHEAINEWAKSQELCRTNSDVALPDGLEEKLKPFFAAGGADAARAEVVEFGRGQVNRETVSRFLMETRGFTRDDLEGVTVPDRVGLKPAYRDMPLADVMAAHLGTQNCNHKWSTELEVPLLHSVADWNTYRPGLVNIAGDPGQAQSSSSMSPAQAASLGGGSPSPVGPGSPVGGDGLPPGRPATSRSPSPAR